MKKGNFLFVWDRKNIVKEDFDKHDSFRTAWLEETNLIIVWVQQPNLQIVPDFLDTG